MRQGTEAGEGVSMTQRRFRKKISIGAPQDDRRFDEPLYTLAEASRYLAVPSSTFANWANGYGKPATTNRAAAKSDPLIACLPREKHGSPVIPFIGLVEGLVLAAWRQSGVPLQRIRPALQLLDQEFGLPHALASSRLFTDGADILYDYAQGTSDELTGEALNELVVVTSGQRVFNEVVNSYLKRLEFGDDPYALRVHLPAYKLADVVVDPRRGFGQPTFKAGGARLEDALAMFQAGESLQVVADEFEVPPDQLEDAIRVAVQTAA